MSRPLDIHDVKRWVVSAVLVLAGHAAAAAILVNYADPIAAGAPSAAIVVDLAPIAAAPEDAQQDVAPGPLSQQVDAPPEVVPDETAEDTPVDAVVTQEAIETEREEKPVETVTEQPPVEKPPEQKPVAVAMAEIEPPDDVVEAKPVQTPQDQPLVEVAPEADTPEVTAATPSKPAAAPPPPPKKKTARRPMQLATAPTPAPERDTRATAPAQGMPSPSSRQAALTWNSAISAALERAKRYPAEAKSRGEQGTAVVSFSIDRSGRVLSSRLARSSGSSALDQETLATVARANLPAAPAEHPGTRFSFSVPIRFNIR